MVSTSHVTGHCFEHGALSHLILKFCHNAFLPTFPQPSLALSSTPHEQISHVDIMSVLQPEASIWYFFCWVAVILRLFSSWLRFGSWRSLKLDDYLMIPVMVSLMPLCYTKKGLTRLDDSHYPVRIHQRDCS